VRRNFGSPIAGNFDSQMRLGMTTGSLSRDAGGLFESVRSLGKNLAELGAEVRAYGLHDNHWEEDAKKWRPVAAEAFPYLGPRAMAYSPAMDVALDAANSDLLHLHGLWQYPSVATRRQWKLNKTPYLISPRGMLDRWALANSRWKKRLAAWLFENAVMRDAACLHALCQAEADAIRAYGLKQRIEVVPNGVELPEELTTEDTESTEGRRRLLFLGRIHPKKGLVGALRAWADIQNSKSKNQNSKEWQFVIAGWDQGGHEAELKALCGDLGLRIADCGTTENLKLNSYKLKTERDLDIQGGLRPDNGSSRRLPLPDVDVVFFGPAFGEEKEALLRSADAFILPSFSEGLPMSVLEAWSYGLPVVMTPECNLPEGFASGAALEIRSGKGSFQDGMRTLIEMTNHERAAMGMRGRRLVEDRFTWPKVAAQMKALYEEVLR
jgi:poly(glycerol-phosphate) alpha-glucosyltransferase